MATTPAKTLVKGLELLDTVAQQEEPMSLAQLAASTGWPKPTLLRVLGTLTEHAMLRLDEGRYRLGVQCLVLGGAFLSAIDVRKAALPVLRSLVEATQETAHLGILDDLMVVYIEKVESRQSVRMHSWVGATNPLYCTGVGKAIVAFSEDSVQNSVIEHGLEPRTPHTITDAAEFRDELTLIRKRGYSVDDEENEIGIRCVAAPVFDHRGSLLAGISVSAPTFRFPDERLHHAIEALLRASSELSEVAGYRPAE